MRFSEGQAIGKRQSLRAAMMDMPRLLEKIPVLQHPRSTATAILAVPVVVDEIGLAIGHRQGQAQAIQQLAQGGFNGVDLVN